MIKPITEEYFKKISGTCKKYRLVQVKTLKELNYSVWSDEAEGRKRQMPWDNLGGYLYFEKPGEGVFAMISDSPNSLLIIPSQYSNLTVSEDESIDFSDWKSTYLGPPNPQYILNVLQRAETWASWSEGLVKSIKDGDYLIENKAIGFSQVVTVKVSNLSWSTHLYVGFPELLELPYNKTLIMKIGDRLKNYILWSQKD